MSTTSVPVIEGFPLSAQQARAWAFSPHAAARRAQVAIAIRGPLDQRALAEAIDRCVQRHEILRTTFQALPGMHVPLQVAAPVSSRAHVCRVDVQLVPAFAEAALVRALLAADARVAFDPARGPILRCALLVRSPEQHTLVLTLPSLCADRQALDNIACELTDDYAAATGGPRQPTDESNGPLQYIDFCEWQRNVPESEANEAAGRFWQRQTAGTGIEAGARDREPAGRAFAPRVLVRDVDADRTRAIRAFAARRQVSEAAFWMACWSFLLWRVRRQADVTIGWVLDGRRYAEMRTAVGPFAKRVPIRCRGPWSRTFAEQVGHLDASMTEAENWQDLYDVSASSAGAGSGGAPEWAYAFEMRTLPPVAAVGGTTFATERQACEGEPFLLTLACVSGESDVSTELRVDVSRLSLETARVLCEQLHLIVSAVLQDEERSAARVDLVTASQRLTLAALNETGIDWPDAHRPLTWHIDAQAARTPDAIAIAGPSGLLTYAALVRVADRLARDLRARAVGPESRVAVLLRRSPRLPAALLGVLKAGAAYVPIEPTDPPGRIAACLEDAGIDLALIDPGVHPPDVPGVRWLTVADPAPAALGEDVRSDPPAAIGRDHLAYVIYTSGSTGTPKGTLITQGGLLNYLLWCVEHYELDGMKSSSGQGAGAPLHSSPAFDLTVTSLFAPLLVGGTVTLAPDVSAGEALAQVLQTGAFFDFVKLTPSHLQALAWQVPPETLASRAGALILGGEALSADALRVWRVAAPRMRIFNEYGPTETVVGSCIFDVEIDVNDAATQTGLLPSTPPPISSVPIGAPIANTQTYVLDRFGVPVLPASAAGTGFANDGELFIGGAGVARGYLNRPDLTAERFTPDPFGSHPGARLYRTGDTVRYDAHGRLVYVGRLDQQVKLRGHRIELGDVEAALRALPGVRDAAATLRQDQPGAAQLVGYLVSSSGERASVEDIRTALLRSVPEYMAPGAIVWMDALPLTRSGKVDRRALPAPVGAAALSGQRVRATTEVEEVLAAIWADVLELDDVGVEDNFFALGGDSIRAIQVRARCGARGLEIGLEQIFEHQTIASIARGVRFGAPAADAMPALTPFALISDDDRSRLAADLAQRAPGGVDVEDAYPVAALQAGMIFHSELAQDTAVFHDIHSFTLHARPDVEQLRTALIDVTKRHTTLRTAFELARYSRPLQIVYRDVLPPLDVTDLSSLDVDEQRATVDAWLDEERRRPFNWREPPLLRFHVHLLGAEAFQFTLSFHHAILDGWSAASLLTDLFQRYQAPLDARGVLPPESAPPESSRSASLLRSSFRDFVALEQQAETSEACQQFWRETLHSVQPIHLGTTGAASMDAASPQKIGSVPVPIDPAIVQGLRKLTRDAALPLKSIALAAHVKVLSIETDQARVLTGLVSNGRPETPDGDRVLGLFLNTVPCVVPTNVRRWRDLAHEAFEAERRLLPFRRYPLARMQRERGEGALFDVAFNFMHYHVYRGVQPSETIQVDGYFGYEETDVPLMANFSLDPQSGEMHLLLAYHPRLFKHEDVERLADRYRLVLAAMAADPDAPHLAADFLTSAEREQVAAAQQPRTARRWEPGDDESLLDDLERQAQATPDGVAVTSGGASVSYRELHARADALADRLRALGVGADDRVGICLDRSPDLLVSLLGILKAGGAYVPLDPAYPQTRLALVVEDAQPTVIVTRSALAARLPASEAALVLVDLVSGPADESSIATPRARVRAGHLAYVMYTSGSTGRPKGVMVPHGAVRNFMRGMDARVGPLDRASWLAVTSISFDISVAELFWTLARGARVVLLPDAALPDAGLPDVGEADAAATDRSPADLICAEGVTHVQCTPSFAWRLLADPLATDALARLDHLLVGGEAPPETLANDLRVRVGGRLHNMYGPTETTIWSSSDLVADSDAIALGRSLANQYCVPCDRAQHLAPPGRVGEICIAGDGVARGYFGRADLTAERFVPAPFGDEPGARMYRTGDWGRLRADGRIEFVGRRDGQVKLRGHRIELAEIEIALRAQPGVRNAVVLLREDEPGDRRLVGYIVATPGETPKTDVVQQLLRASLPEHMVPAVIVSLDALPLTPNGKIDRLRLPAPAGERPDLTQHYEPPRTEMEETLVRIWGDVLRVDRVGIHDNFFALGGHSLSATQVVARLRDALGVDVPLRPLFESPTIARLAPVIDAHREGGRLPSAAQTETASTDDTPDLDALLDQLEDLPDDEVRALLGGEP